MLRNSCCMIRIFRLKGLRCEQVILDLGRRLRHWSFPSKPSKFSPCEGCPAVHASSTHGCPWRQKIHDEESNISFGFVFEDKFERSLFFCMDWGLLEDTLEVLRVHWNCILDEVSVEPEEESTVVVANRDAFRWASEHELDVLVHQGRLRQSHFKSVGLKFAELKQCSDVHREEDYLPVIADLTLFRRWFEGTEENILVSLNDGNCEVRSIASPNSS